MKVQPRGKIESVVKICAHSATVVDLTCAWPTVPLVDFVDALRSSVGMSWLFSAPMTCIHNKYHGDFSFSVGFS